MFARPRPGIDYVGGYVRTWLLIDMRLPEKFKLLRSPHAGLPWQRGWKPSHQSINCVLSMATVPDPDDLELRLKVDGEVSEAEGAHVLNQGYDFYNSISHQPHN